MPASHRAFRAGRFLQLREDIFFTALAAFRRGVDETGEAFSARPSWNDTLAFHPRPVSEIALDDDIDYSDAPQIDWSNAVRGKFYRPIKKSVTLRLDADVLAWLTTIANVAGVDLMRSNHGPVVLEVNSSPGLEGIEVASGVDIADAIVEFIEDNAEHEPGGRGRG